MKSLWKLSEASRRSEAAFHGCLSPARPYSSQSSAWKSIIPLFKDPTELDPDSPIRLQDLTLKTSALKHQILACDAASDSRLLFTLLDGEGFRHFKSYPDGSAFVQLLEQLRTWPTLALEVLNWRRKLDDPSLPMTSEEYSKGITLAGKVKDVELAVELFQEAAKVRVKTASTYNALMGVYMVNGLSRKCQLLFRRFKREESCSPTIVTYNMLLSIFGRLMLVDHMEATLAEIKKANLTPTLKTYNNLIAGYLSAWMWDRMEDTYLAMKASSVEPDANTYLLMLRGYSHSGNLVKMEEMHDCIVGTDFAEDIIMVRTMICAYCKSPSADRISKIEELMKLIPEDQYRPWLNVLLIKVYAQEGLMDKMEDLISEAFERRTSVHALGVMRAIITAFFLRDAVDKLADFIRRAEYNGWRLCRSLYHCKMTMYGSQNRLMEMASVPFEMDQVGLARTKKTFAILYKVYKQWGQTHQANQIRGLMCKQGYGIYLDESLS